MSGLGRRFDVLGRYNNKGMTLIAVWPVVARHRIVRAFKPGGSSSAEGPFRTLRRHEWVSSGVRVSRHTDRGLAGQVTVFSSLNLVAARLARRGDAAAAERVARTAADLESGQGFALLQRLLSDLPTGEAEQVIDGVLPESAPADLAEALRAVASRTERVRADCIPLSSPLEVLFAGQIVEATEGYVVLKQIDGLATVVPRWMAASARRDRLGDLLALVSDRLDGASAVIEAMGAIDVGDIYHGFSPFARGDGRALSINAEDAHLLAGEPQPLRIVVPVIIEG